MAFEETLVCDGCSRVVDGGSRDNTLRTLRTLRDGGRAFDRGRRGGWVERPASESWVRTQRHLCADCANCSKFYDGEPVPAPVGPEED
jgi:hypothetical protein